MVEYRLEKKSDGLWLYVKFPYDPNKIAAIKKLPFSRWMQLTREWRVLATQQVVDVFEKEFGWSVPEHIKKAIKQYNPWEDLRIWKHPQQPNTYYVALPCHLIHLKEHIKKFFRLRRWRSEITAWEITLTNQQEVERFVELFGDRTNDVVDEFVFVVEFDGSTATITTPLPYDISEELDQEMRFHPAGYEHSDAYKSGMWDGYIHLYKRSTQTFPVGLLPIAVKILSKHGKVMLKDNRRETGIRIPNLSWNFPHPLRPYQQNAIQQMLSDGMTLISLPTGAGKTVIALRYIYEVRKPTLIIVHMKHLLDQWVKNIQEILGYVPGVWGGGRKNPDPYITVAMLQTLNRELPPHEYDVLIVDEAHHIPADTLFDVCLRMKCKYRFGLSATPWRTDNKTLMIQAVTGHVYEIPIVDLVRSGVLARPLFIFVRYHTSKLTAWDDWMRAYDELIVNNQERNDAIVSVVRFFHNLGEKVYVDVKRIQHGRHLEKLLLNAGIPAVFIHGGTADVRRRLVLENFRNRGRFVLVSTLIKEGADIPSMSVCVLAGGGKSEIQLIQTVGRALRPKTFNVAFVVDFEDRGEYVYAHFRNRYNALKSYYQQIFKPRFVRAERIEDDLRRIVEEVRNDG